MLTPLIAIAPMYEEPRHTSALVTEMLFGERADVLEVGQGDWLKIRLTHDDYEGWVIGSMLHELQEGSMYDYAPQIPSRLPLIIENVGWIPLGAMVTAEQAGLETTKHLTEPTSAIAQYALLWLCAPYRWGGRTGWGIDCSGLVQLAARLAGYSLPRDAKDQAKLGEDVGFVSGIQDGDLAFFGELKEVEPREKPREESFVMSQMDDLSSPAFRSTDRTIDSPITHVGIAMGNGRIIHASGSVRVDLLDQQGIYNATKRAYTHELRAIRRLG